MPTAPTDLIVLVNGYEARFMSRFNTTDSLIIVQIIKKGDILGDPYLVSLNDERGRLPEGTLIIKTVDNDDDPYTPIKAKLASIKFFSSNTATLSSFMVGESDEWSVTIYTDAVDAAHVIFKGFLVLDVATEPYETKPYEVTLTATDNLGILKKVPLTDFNGNNPKGDNKLIKYIAWALSKTNMQLPIYVNNNLFEENNPGIPFYESCYVSAKTFEKELTSTGAVSEDCYNVLTKIFGNDSRIEQINGAWWIERIYEKRHVANYVHQFDYDGTYVGVSSPTFYLQSIDQRDYIDFINDNAQVTTQSPYKSNTIKYPYNFPREIVDNIDFSRGDLYTELPMPNITFEGVTYYQRKYHIDDWIALEVPTGIIGGTSSLSTTKNYVRRLFLDSTLYVEQEKCVVIEAGATAKGYYIQSNKIPVVKNDKFDISVNVRWTNDGAFPGSGDYRIAVMQVRLHGNSGTNYMLCGGYQIGADNFQIPFWKIAGSSFSGVENIYVQGNLTEAMNDWKTASFITKTSSNPHPCPPLPESGYLEILLTHTSYSNNTDIHFNNLTFKYIPYINGGYPDFSGEEHKVSQSGNYLNVLENEIYINNTPNALYRGALKIFGSWQTFLTSQATITTTIFGSNLRIVTAVATGDVRSYFTVGTTFKITGTANNDGVYTVASVNYNAGNTVIETVETLVTDSGIPTVTFQHPNYVLAGLFYDGQTFPSGIPSSEYLHSYAYQLIYSLWQQYRTFKRSIDSDFLGLKSVSPLTIPDLQKQYFFSDNNPNVNNKYFILLHYEQDFDSQIWRAFLREVYDTTIGHVFSDPYEFKYITE